MVYLLRKTVPSGDLNFASLSVGDIDIATNGQVSIANTFRETWSNQVLEIFTLKFLSFNLLCGRDGEKGTSGGFIAEAGPRESGAAAVLEGGLPLIWLSIPRVMRFLRFLADSLAFSGETAAAGAGVLAVIALAEAFHFLHSRSSDWMRTSRAWSSEMSSSAVMVSKVRLMVDIVLILIWMLDVLFDLVIVRLLNTPEERSELLHWRRKYSSYRSCRSCHFGAKNFVDDCNKDFTNCKFHSKDSNEK